MLLTSNPEPSAFTDEEKTAVYEQMDRLLLNPYFSHSRRFPALLRFVVESTLSGRADQLKERTLGVEIFGKRAHYDTANDPIVRVTAAEIRKRIALYYGEPGHESELRVSLPAGSYVPHFEWPRVTKPAVSEVDADKTVPSSVAELPPTASSAHVAEVPEPSVVATGSPASSPQPTLPRSTLPRGVAFGILATVLMVLVAVAFYLWKSAPAGSVKTFWAPLLDSTDPVLFCVSDQTQYKDIQLRDAAEPARQTLLHDSLTAVIIDNIAPIAEIAGILRQNGKQYTIRGEGATTLNDLRGGPAIFIGAYDNAWTLRLLKPLRFHFANNREMTRFWIVDETAGKPTPWVVDRREQIATNVYRDYAIVSRFTDSNTGRLAIVVAGIGRGGTIAAGEFLTTPALLDQITSVLRFSAKKNVEFVLSTQIIGGEPGAPRVEASYAW